MLVGRYKTDSVGGSTGTVWMPIWAYEMGVHIGATWQIRLNRQCEAEIRLLHYFKQSLSQKPSLLYIITTEENKG